MPYLRLTDYLKGGSDDSTDYLVRDVSNLQNHLSGGFG